ncbi:MAG TPA: hypothetical protein PLZ53_09175 [Candidatus Hydrogenedentes bacterium]|jgi:hypothetical protein|nr:hypothetical protein [Candidatus Hydrogenedentota bacterium]HPX85415.1 hypothetical protein [Candidatus Hydrogenedentota bacterium]HQB01713.1 hypothetical protein [Candidatus Hydrogenedentota bacterium]
MTALIFLLTATCFGQSWDSPVITEAELAPPGAISAPAPSAPSRSSDLESRTESDRTPVTELQWEYDEEGQPVARPVTGNSAQNAPKEKVSQPAAAPAPASAPAEAPREKTTANRGPRQAATFWFMLMNR